MINIVGNFVRLPEADASASEPAKAAVYPGEEIRMADLTAARSRSSIKAAWERLKPRYAGTPYADIPSLQAPYAPGKLQPAFIQDGLNMVNFVRYLADLPADIEANASLNAIAQHGAVLLHAAGKLDHRPQRPADMEADFYETGYRSASTSNLAKGYRTLHEAVIGYMDDSDPRNIGKVGHRRWILSPQLKKAGFGFAGSYSTISVTDRSRESLFVYDAIPYPARGPFPLQFFHPRQVWSISLNPEIYKTPDPALASITLRHPASGRVWTIGRQDKDMLSGAYGNVSAVMYAGSPAIVFRPDLTADDSGVLFADGSLFEVTVEGLEKTDGSAATLQYEVEFFDLDRTPVGIFLNGREVRLTPDPLTADGRVLVPMRPLFARFGAEVTWDRASGTIYAALGDRSLQLPAGGKEARVTETDGERTIALDVPAQIRGGTTYVPIGFAAQLFGLRAAWNPEAWRVELTQLEG